MRIFSGFWKGIVALIAVATILLLSDLGNRTGRKEGHDASSGKHGILKMCLIHFVDTPNSEDCEKGFRDCLKDTGWTEGKEFSLTVYHAQGDISALNSIAGTVASQSWDMIVANSTPTIQVLAKRQSTRPVVFTNVGDPVMAGLGKSFSDHMSGITGVSTMSDFDGMIDLLVELQPGIRKIGTVFAPAEINSVAYKDALEKAAAKRGIRLICAGASNSSEVNDAAVSVASRGIEAFCQISDNLTASCISSIIKTAANSNLPLYGFVTSLMKLGAVAVVARDYHQAGYDAGTMAKKVLDGIPPANIPFQVVQKTITLIDATRAARFGIKIPAALSDKINPTN